VEILESLKTLLELGWPGIVLAAVVVIWRSYQVRTAELIEILRQQRDECQRKNEVLLGIILDNAKMQFTTETKLFPRDKSQQNLEILKEKIT